MGGFIGITENMHFYINEAGNSVVIFEKYEVALGANWKSFLMINDESSNRCVVISGEKKYEIACC